MADCGARADRVDDGTLPWFGAAAKLAAKFKPRFCYVYAKRGNGNSKKAAPRSVS